MYTYVEARIIDPGILLLEEYASDTHSKRSVSFLRFRWRDLRQSELRSYNAAGFKGSRVGTINKAIHSIRRVSSDVSVTMSIYDCGKHQHTTWRAFRILTSATKLIYSSSRGDEMATADVITK